MRSQFDVRKRIGCGAVLRRDCGRLHETEESRNPIVRKLEPELFLHLSVEDHCRRLDLRGRNLDKKYTSRVLTLAHTNRGRRKKNDILSLGRTRFKIPKPAGMLLAGSPKQAARRRGDEDPQALEDAEPLLGLAGPPLRRRDLRSGLFV